MEKEEGRQRRLELNAMHHRKFVIALLFAIHSVVAVRQSACDAVVAREGPCPPLEAPGLTIRARMERCGTRPTRKDIILKPTDNVRNVVAKARENSFIFFSKGTYFNGIEDIKPPNGATLWAEPKTVTFAGGNRRRGIMNDWGRVVNVRIYGIRFEGYNVNGYDGVITAPTNGFGDGFNARADSRWGFNPSGGWVIDCCTFSRWTSENGLTVGNAIKCGSGMVVRGNRFVDGEGLGVSCPGKDVTIDGNRFVRIQMKRKFDSAHCGAIKLLLSKNATITNNFFKDVSCKAVWLDINPENNYVAHNEAYSIGKSFFQLETGGTGNIAEYNKVEGFGWNQPISGGGVSL